MTCYDNALKYIFINKYVLRQILYIYVSKSFWELHVNYIKEEMETNLPILSHKFSCICCTIRTNNKKDYNNHILTAKHSKLTTVNNEETIIPNI